MEKLENILFGPTAWIVDVKQSLEYILRQHVVLLLFLWVLIQTLNFWYFVFSNILNFNSLISIK